MEQLHPCVKCGACCAFFRIVFHWSETLDDSFRVPSSMALNISPHLNAMKGTNQPEPRCVALEGEIGTHAICRIYENRPSCCRNFKPSYEDGTHNERCDQARVAKGLAPLTREDWSS